MTQAELHREISAIAGRIYKAASKGYADRTDLESFARNARNANAAARECNFEAYSDAVVGATALGEQFAQAATDTPEASLFDQQTFIFGAKLREAFDQNCVCNRRK